MADHVVDLGPEAGEAGGRVVFEGAVGDLRRADTATGAYLRGARRLRERTREPTGVLVAVEHAVDHNLRDARRNAGRRPDRGDRGRGSGKSSLAAAVLEACPPMRLADQTALRGARRSSPATYLGVLGPVRRAFARANDRDGGTITFTGTPRDLVEDNLTAQHLRRYLSGTP